MSHNPRVFVACVFVSNPFPTHKRVRGGQLRTGQFINALIRARASAEKVSRSGGTMRFSDCRELPMIDFLKNINFLSGKALLDG